MLLERKVYYRLTDRKGNERKTKFANCQVLNDRQEATAWQGLVEHDTCNQIAKDK